MNCSLFIARYHLLQIVYPFEVFFTPHHLVFDFDIFCPFEVIFIPHHLVFDIDIVGPLELVILFGLALAF